MRLKQRPFPAAGKSFSMGVVLKGAGMKRNLILHGFLFSFLFLLGGLGAPWAKADPATSPTPADTADPVDEVTSLHEEITAMEDSAKDKELKFNLDLFQLTQELLKDKMEGAQKAGDAKKASECRAEMDRLAAERDAIWDEEIPILEARHKLRSIRFDLAIQRLQSEISRTGDGEFKKLDYLKENLETLQKVKLLTDDYFQLSEQLSGLQRKGDLAATQDIYQKLKDLRQKQRDLSNDENQQLLQNIGKYSGEDSQNL
jgi:hypothetical protein